MVVETGEAHQDPRATVSYHRVANNAVIYFIAQVISWAVTFLTISIIPRTLGETAMGQLAVLGAAFSPAGTLLSCGLENYLTKEVGRDPQQAERLLRASIGLRITLHLPGMLASLIALWLIRPSPSLWWLGILSILLSFPGGVTDLFRSVLAGWEQAKRVSLLDFISTLTPIFALPFLHYGAPALVVASFLMTLFIMVVRLCWVRQTVRVRPTFDVALWKQMIRGGMPFVANGFAATLYGATATFMLRHYTDDAAVGVYSQATRLFGTFLFVPTVIGYALLPSLARLADTAPEEFRTLQHRVLGILVLFGLPVMAGMVMLAPALCHILYGPHKFTTLPLALQCYALVLIPMYIVTTMYQFLVAQNRNWIWSIVLLVTAVLYAVMSMAFIPWGVRSLHNGVAGAVTTTFWAEAFGVVAVLILLRLNPFTRELMNRLSRALLATLGMVAVMWFTRDQFLLVPAMAGGVVFIALIWNLGVLSMEERAQLVGLVRRKLRMRA